MNTSEKQIRPSITLQANSHAGFMNEFEKQLFPFLSLIFIFSLWTFLEPDKFLSLQNLSNVLCRSAANGIMATGMTFIIITAGIDLSIGSMLSLSAIVGSITMLALSGASWAQIASGAAIEMTLMPMIIGTFAGILFGALCGFANGMMITRLKLAPFIVTLGSMSIFRGISYLCNDSKPITVREYTWLDNGTILGIPSSVVLFVILLLVMGYLLKYTPYGRYTYAIGSNENTAFHVGVNVNAVKVWIYTITGALVGLAGMITTARSSSAQPTAGLSLELDIIAAVIIGGCSPNGGRGTMTGTLIGTLLISFLRNGLNLLDISTNVQLVFVGFIIIFAVTADQIAARRANS